MKLIQNEDQSKKDGNPRKETELVGLIEDFYNQYESLYALYGRLVTGEYVKAVPSRGRRLSSVSSSSSESEYFSSEEGDSSNRRPQIENINGAEVNDQNQGLFSRERQHSNLANTHEVVVKTRASITEAKEKEFEEQLNSQMKELESLNLQKRNLELQVESQAQEVKQLSAKNTKLHTRVFELQLLLKKTEGAVSVLHTKLKNNEDQAVSKITELMARINKLEQEAKSLRSQKGKMEEKIRRSRHEALSQRKEFTDQLNVMQQKFDSACIQNKEFEAELETERNKVSQHLVRIENLEGNSAETNSAEQRMVKERECFLSRIKDLELELESRCSKQNELEEQLRETSCEITRLKEERKALQDRNHELKRATMTQREEGGASVEDMDLTAEVDDLRLELDALQEQKNKLELQNERSQKEYSESLAKLEAQVAYQEDTIKKQMETIEQIRAEHYKQAELWSKKLKLSQQLAERKMEELAQEFRKKMEDNIRLLHQRIHVAEQLNNENKVSYKATKQRYEEENKMLGEKVAKYENDLKTLKVRGTPSPVTSDQNGLELAALNGLELDFAAGKKLEEHREYVLSLVSKMLGEVQFTKDWIKKRNGEMKQMKDNVDRLTALLGEKEKQELLLREKVWKLEANLSKEGGEKLNLMKAVSQLERKVGKLEKNLKEKDEELVALGEKKREAIRQLCFLIEFHRQRYYDRLKDLVTKTRATHRT